MLRVSNLTGFGNGGTFDTTPPSILSDATYTVDGNTALAFTIETDEPVHIALSGADASEFELATPSSYSAAHVLRWLSNGVRDYTSPQDTDTDNVYEVTLTPTDQAGNVGTPQALEVTVDQNWVNSFNAGDDWPGEAFVSGVTIRMVIPGSALSTSGSNVRFTLKCPDAIGSSTSIAAMYIGEYAGSGDAYDMKSSAPAPTQVLVGGSGSFTLPYQGDDVKTDSLAFAIDETKTYVIAMAITGSGAVPRTAAAAVSGAQGYSKSGNDASTANATGYGTSGSAGAVSFIKKIDVL